ncbi:MAG: non-homologous end-joining DNA ligase [Actinomycetota bacterium]|nr:non-homologous end-joining DNA ligase [Actinomycetota bacterium]
MARVEITHADRVLFPEDGITKGELVDYYTGIADAMLPHLRDRPLTLWRYPAGIDQKGFVQQDFGDSLPDWLTGVEVDKESGGTVVHPVADRRDALRWIANQNCVTVHSWLSHRDDLHRPDRIVFDLDPSGDDFAEVKASARAVADVLDDLGLKAYVQTTGSRGLHVVTPIRAEHDFDEVRQFAREVADLVVADAPDHRTVEVRKNKRGGRVYLDVMRNAYAQTAVAPYAVRATPGAPAATPLEWDELGRRGLRADRFTIRDLPKRVAERGDPWSQMNRHARTLSRPLQRLAKLHA